MLAIGTGDGRMRLVEASTGKARLDLDGFSRAVRAVALSPEGNFMAGASNSREIKIWDTMQGDELVTIKGHDGDGLCVCTMDEAGGCRKVDAACKVSGHSDEVLAIDFSPCGKKLASGGADKLVYLWDATAGTLIRKQLGHTGPVLTVCWSPNGNLLASASIDRIIFVVDAATGAPVRRLARAHAQRINSIRFSPDSLKIASGGGDNIPKIWNLHGPEMPKTMTGHSHPIFALAFSPDGQSIATASQDFTVKIWDSNTGAEKRSLRGHDGRTGGPPGGPPGGGPPCLCRPGAPAPACALVGHRYIATTVAWSVDGKMLASGSYDSTCRVWDTANGALLGTLEMCSIVNSVAMGPDFLNTVLRRAAVAMGLQERLGANSPIKVLGAEAVRLILDRCV